MCSRGAAHRQLLPCGSRATCSLPGARESGGRGTRLLGSCGAAPPPHQACPQERGIREPERPVRLQKPIRLTSTCLVAQKISTLPCSARLLPKEDLGEGVHGWWGEEREKANQRHCLWAPTCSLLPGQRPVAAIDGSFFRGGKEQTQ